MNLHSDRKLFEEAIRATALHLSLPMMYVEKDYWVTVALKSIAHSDIGSKIVFKGGTSLSKAYGLISRFSEDIDIAVITKSLSDSQVRRRVKKASGLLPECFTEMDSPDTSKNSNFRKIRFKYPKLGKDQDQKGQVANSLLLEINSFTEPEPHKLMSISSYVADFLSTTGNVDEIIRSSLQPFQMKVLCTSRTLCEKIIGMTKASSGQNHINNINNKIRHLYDIYYLMTDEFTNNFFHSDVFLEMASRVIENDRQVFPDAEWVNKPLTNAIVFSNLESIWGQLESTYYGVFKKMVVGSELPLPESLFEMSKKIHAKLVLLDSK